MSDTTALARAIRAWAERADTEIDDYAQQAHADQNDALAELAIRMANQFATLGKVLDGHLDAERARLVAAVEAAEAEASAADVRFGDVDNAVATLTPKLGPPGRNSYVLTRQRETEAAAEAAHQAADAARAALAAWDEAGQP